MFASAEERWPTILYNNNFESTMLGPQAVLNAFEVTVIHVIRCVADAMVSRPCKTAVFFGDK